LRVKEDEAEIAREKERKREGEEIPHRDRAYLEMLCGYISSGKQIAYYSGNHFNGICRFRGASQND